MANAQRGFASMEKSKQREIASKGGKTAHQKGTAHEWTREEARVAGRKGGLMHHRRASAADLSSPAADAPSAKLPRPGDVLVSNPATIEHEISIMPGPPHLRYPTHDLAVAKGREIAEQLGVDAWVTEDRSHFLLIASCRSGHGGRSDLRD
jgi:general stress protein YciG